MLITTNEKLMDTNETLRDRVEELEEALEAERAVRKQVEEEANATQDLVKAIRDYLSWKESPPTMMDVAVYAGIERTFRATLETTLRKLEG